MVCELVRFLFESAGVLGLSLTGILYLQSGWIYLCPQRLDLFVTCSGIILIGLRGLVLAQAAQLVRIADGPYRLVVYGWLILTFLYGVHHLGALICWHAISHSSPEGKELFHEYLTGYTFYVLYSLTLLAVFGIQTAIAISSDHYLGTLRSRYELRRKHQEFAQAMFFDPHSVEGSRAAFYLVSNTKYSDWPPWMEQVLMDAYIEPTSQLVTPRNWVHHSLTTCAICSSGMEVGERFVVHPVQSRRVSLLSQQSSTADLTGPGQPTHVECLRAGGVWRIWGSRLLLRHPNFKPIG